MRFVTSQALTLLDRVSAMGFYKFLICQVMTIRAELRDFLYKEVLVCRNMRCMATEADSLLLHGRMNESADLPQTFVQFRMAGKAELIDSFGQVTFLFGPVGVMA